MNGDVWIDLIQKNVELVIHLDLKVKKEEDTMYIILPCFICIQTCLLLVDTNFKFHSLV